LLVVLGGQGLVESFTHLRLFTILFPLCDPDLMMCLLHFGFDHPSDYPTTFDGIDGHLICFLKPLLAEQENGMERCREREEVSGENCQSLLWAVR